MMARLVARHVFRKRMAEMLPINELAVLPRTLNHIPVLYA